MKQQIQTRKSQNTHPLSRRGFSTGMAATAASLAATGALSQEPESGTKPRIKLGVVGCGGRGTWIAAPTAAMADALSTAAMVMEHDAIQRCCRKNQDIAAFVAAGDRQTMMAFHSKQEAT